MAADTAHQAPAQRTVYGPVARCRRQVLAAAAPLVHWAYRLARAASYRPDRILEEERRLFGDSSPLNPSELAACRGVKHEISPWDTMYRGNLEHYYRVGYSALECIDDVLRAAGVTECREVLDLPCGFGRVLRFLQYRFPRARLHGCDIDRRGVDFCVERFGIEGFYSQADFQGLPGDKLFDLVWCGSLVTHLDATGIDALFRFVHGRLTPGGVFAFSTHGRRAVEFLEAGGSSYKLRGSQRHALVTAYAESGYGFENYSGQLDYGISVTSPDWIRRQLESTGRWRQVHFGENQWDDHQDIYGVVKLPA